MPTAGLGECHFFARHSEDATGFICIHIRRCLYSNDQQNSSGGTTYAEISHHDAVRLGWLENGAVADSSAFPAMLRSVVAQEERNAGPGSGQEYHDPRIARSIKRRIILALRETDDLPAYSHGALNVLAIFCIAHPGPDL